jgi:hypothetical protein
MNHGSSSCFDVESGDWGVTPGDFEILIGQAGAAMELRRKPTFTK